MESESQARDKGIVWIASYPRSGNTWTRNFLYNLLALVYDGDAAATEINRLAEYSVWEIAAPGYEAVLGKKLARASRAEIATARPVVQERLVAGAAGPALVKTHNALVLDRDVPTINMAVTSGAVYIVRNPLDVSISLAHHAGVELDTAISRMASAGFESAPGADGAHEVYGSWSVNVMSWTGKPHRSIHVVRYEDLLDRPVESFAAMARHLLIDAGRDQIARAVERASFDRAKLQERKSGYRERPSTSDAFFREGRAGQWRRELSRAQASRIVEDHREQMQRFGYVPDGY